MYWEPYLRPCDVKNLDKLADSLREDGHLVLPFFAKHNRPVLIFFLHAAAEYKHSFHVADDSMRFLSQGRRYPTWSTTQRLETHKTAPKVIHLYSRDGMSSEPTLR